MTRLQIGETDNEKLVSNVLVKDCVGQGCAVFQSTKNAFYSNNRVFGFLINQRFDPVGEDETSGAQAQRVFKHKV